MFIGYPRSGHSLVGSLLNAHPDVLIAHELDALRYIGSGVVGRAQLLSLIVQAERQFGRSDRHWTGYDYKVPAQWQGRHRVIKVIGDKKGGRSTIRLSERPELLQRLQHIVRMPVHLLHVIRNPYDTIATMYQRGHGSIATCTDRFFVMCATNRALRDSASPPTIDLHLEQLIDDPQCRLEEVCRRLGLDPTHDYLAACASIVAPHPHASRFEIQWEERELVEVARRMSGFAFLQGYTFED